MENDRSDLAFRLANDALHKPLRRSSRAIALLIAQHSAWRLGEAIDPWIAAEGVDKRRMLTVLRLCQSAGREADALRLATAKAFTAEARLLAGESGHLSRVASAAVAEIARDGGLLSPEWANHHLAWAEYPERSCPLEVVIIASRALAQSCASAGQFARAAAILHRLNALGLRHALPRVAAIALDELINLHLHCGDYTVAVSLFEDLANLSDHDTSLCASSLLEMDAERLKGAARLTCYSGRLHDADILGQAATLRERALVRGKRRLALTIDVQSALVQEAIGDHDGAVTLAARVMSAAARTGYKRCLIEDVERLRPIVLRVRARRSNPPDVAACAAWLDLAQQAPRPIPTRPMAALTPRERHILPLLGRGLTNKEIARVLQIAPDTVKTHLRNIFDKLGVASRAEAVNVQLTHPWNDKDTLSG